MSISSTPVKPVLASANAISSWTRFSGADAPAVTATVSHALQPLRIHLAAHRPPGRPARPHSSQTSTSRLRIRAVLRAHHQQQVAQRRHRLHRQLPVLGGVADVLRRRPLDAGKSLPQPRHDIAGFRPGSGWSGSDRRSAAGPAAPAGPRPPPRTTRNGMLRGLPSVPITSSWSLCPISTMRVSLRARTARPPDAPWSPAGRWRRSPRSRRWTACSRTAGDTPCALKITRAPSGTSSSSSTNTAPARRSSSTTCRLWTISFRT